MEKDKIENSDIKILIVDDNSDNLEIYEEYLKDIINILLKLL